VVVGEHEPDRARRLREGVHGAPDGSRTSARRSVFSREPAADERRCARHAQILVSPVMSIHMHARPFHVLIAGGGVAALETMARHDLGPQLADGDRYVVAA